MSNGSHAIGTTIGAKLGASARAVGGTLGVVRRVRLPQRDRDAEIDPSRAIPPGGLLGTLRKLPRWKLLLALMLAGAVIAVVVGSVLAAPRTFQVDNITSDASDSDLTDNQCRGVGLTGGNRCTLRAAIEQANANSNPADTDIINFNTSISGTISPSKALPAITQPVIIDGGTTHSIELNGAGAGASAIGLDINASNVTVKGLVINRFGGNGINIRSGSGSQVQGNYIGTNVAGTAALPNGGNGVGVAGSNNTIGGTTTAARNVISGNNTTGVSVGGGSGNQVQGNYIGTNAAGTATLGNIGHGVQVSGSHIIGGTTAGAGNVISGNSNQGVISLSGSQVQGNYIGTNAAGTAALPNGGNGVGVVGANNTIGGTTAAARNVISGNLNSGIVLQGGSGNQVQGNYIGTNATGTAALSNIGHGVWAQGASNNTIGGTTAAARNVISGNNNSGIFLQQGSGSQVQGNYIGTNAAETAALANGDTGVLMVQSSGNVIGGTVPSAGNVISGNTRTGVGIISSSVANRVQGNSIYSNGALGIDLEGDGPTPNDSGDGDSGANNQQNFPELTSAKKSASGTTTIEGKLNSTVNTTFSIQFFSSPEADPSEYGEGKTYLGQTSVTTDSSGNAPFTFNSTTPSGGEVITATATSPGNDTSEFSKATTVSTNSPPVANTQTVSTNEDTSKLITLSADDADGNSLTYKITALPTNGELYKGDSTAPSNKITSAGTSLGTGVNQVTYKPNAEYSGSDSFKFVANDGTADSDTAATVAITVNAVNDAPSFTKGEDQTVLEDAGAQTVEGWATDIKAGPDNEASQTVSFDVSTDNSDLFSTQPAISSSGTLTYTPAENAYGSATVTVEARDSGDTANSGDNTSDPQTFTITVTSVNDAPSFTKGADETVNEDAGAQTVEDWATSISAGPSNESSQTLTFEVTSNDNPTLFSQGPAVSSDGTLTYTPADDANGIANLKVRLKDSGGTDNSGTDASAEESFKITVSPVNDAPDGVEDEATTAEDNPVNINVLSNDTDIEGDALSVSNFSQGTNGTVGCTPEGICTYTPNADFNGEDSFTYTVTDGKTGSSVTVTVIVTAVNDAPSFTKGEDQTVLEDAGAQSVSGWATNIKAGADNESSQTLTFEVTSNDNPTLFSQGPAVSSDGTLTYTPADDANGIANLKVRLKDSGGTDNSGTDASAEESFKITVSPVNDAPSFELPDPADQTIDEDPNPRAQSVSGFATDISAGPADEEPSQNVTLDVTNNNNALFSTQPTINAVSGDLSYAPAENANGEATVTVIAEDSGGTDTTIGDDNTSDPQTFKITVRPVNDPPDAVDDSASTNQDQAVDVNVLANDKDVDGDSLSVNFDRSSVEGGTVAQKPENPDGALTYTPKAGFNGTDSFAYTISDGKGGTDNATVNIRVIDNVAPQPPSTPDLAATSDSGSSDSDNITRETNLTFSGSAEAGSKVEVFAAKKGSGGTFGTPERLNGPVNANDSGQWTLSGTLNEGIYQITAKATDAANNTSNASGSLEVTVDTTAPTLSLQSPSGTVRSASEVTATFSEGMDSNTINTSTFKLELYSNGGWLTYPADQLTVSYDPPTTPTKKATLKRKDGKALNNANYRVTIAGAKDLAGNALPTTTWTFTVNSRAR